MTDSTTHELPTAVMRAWLLADSDLQDDMVSLICETETPSENAATLETYVEALLLHDNDAMLTMHRALGSVLLVDFDFIYYLTRTIKKGWVR